MHRTKSIFTLNISNIAPYIPFIFFTVIFVIGVLIGCLSVGNFESLISYASDEITEFISLRKNSGFYELLKSSVFSVFSIYIVLFLCGTSVVGCVVSPFVLLYKGFTYGCLSGYLYFTYKLEGIMLNSLLIIPSVLISVFGLIILGKEAFSFSYLLSGICIKSNKPINIYAQFKIYCIKSLTTLIAAVISVIFDLGMSVLFLNFFNL